MESMAYLPFLYIFLSPLQKVTGNLLGVCLLKVAIINPPLLTCYERTSCKPLPLWKPFFSAYNPKQNKSQGCPLMLQRSSTAILSRRHSFLQWWKCFASVLSIMVASSYMWLLSTENVAAVTEGLNFYLYLTLIKFKEPHVIPSAYSSNLDLLKIKSFLAYI